MNEIVVGIDGSDNSLAAVDWAAEEASRRNTALRIVYAIAPWVSDTPVGARIGVVHEWLLGGAQPITDRSITRARDRAPEVRVSGDTTDGQAAAALIDEARGAVMLVVGSRGMGGLAGMLAGSVALQVVSHARCPTVVVRREEHPPQGEVVLGVDGSSSCAAAVSFAFEEAALRKARLRAVLAWPHPVSTEPGDMQPLAYDPEIVTKEEERTLHETIAGWQEEFPDVEVVHEVLHARPAKALAGASARADLLVVGSRGRGGFAGLMLGSVSHAMLHHSHCPVAVVPPQIG
ncbi:universal stress protein [Spirillospora sp. NPDC048911]|uniref:universal stress protein n=1 Tax=Spirillospora sp. NPDC048911 TaxID=3364527 RepID=UPI00371A3BA8